MNYTTKNNTEVFKVFLRPLFSTILTMVFSAQIFADSVSSCDSNIDDVTTTQVLSANSGIDAYETYIDAGTLGGERDVSITNLSAAGGASVVSPAGTTLTTFSNAASVESVLTIQYDGTDGDASTLNPTGLGGLDFSAFSNLNFTGLSDKLNVPLTIELWSDATHYSTLTQGMSYGTDNYTYLFTSFVPAGSSGGVDLGNIGAIVVKIDATGFAGGSIDASISDLSIGCAASLVSVISNEACSNNGTFSNASDDFISFKLTPGAPSAYYEDPYTYSVTATYLGNAVDVFNLDGTVANNIPYGVDSYFKINNGTLVSGSDFVITVTPDWGGYASEILTLLNTGTCSQECTVVSGGNTISYSYASPYSSADLINASANLPLFNEGTNKILTGVELEYGSNYFTGAVFENASASLAVYKFKFSLDYELDIGVIPISTTFSTSNILETSSYPGFTFLQAPVLVPASGTYLGDSGSPVSTIYGMEATSGNFIQGTLLLARDPRLDPRWVTTLTGNGTDDDDMIVLTHQEIYSNTETYSSAADLNQFKGAGVLPTSFYTYSSATSSGGGGNVIQIQRTQSSYFVRVKYTYGCLGTPPVAVDDTKSNPNPSSPSNPTTLTTISNDTDPENDLNASTVNITTAGATDTDADGDNDSLVVTGEGTWTVNPTTGDITFTPTVGFTTDPTPITYNVTDNTGKVSNDATETVYYSQTPVEPIIEMASLAGYVWIDDNHNGIQEPNENSVKSVRVYLLDANGNRIQNTGVDVFTDTNSTGRYLFSDLNPLEEYAVEFDLSTLPDGYEVTLEGEGTDEEDSDGNPATGKTDNVSLVAGELLSHVDLGIYSPTAHIGDYFWIDTNANGIQDPGEKPVVGATVELFDAQGNPVTDTNGNTSIITDTNGKYGFDVEPGTYQVKFTLPATGYEGYVFSSANQGDDAKDTDVDGRGFTKTVTVDAGDNVLTLDAGINCGCSDVSTDSADTLGFMSMLGMMLLTLMMGLFFVRKEEILQA